MKSDLPEYKIVADVLNLVSKSPDQNFDDKAHIRVNDEWLAVARDSLDALLDQASAVNIVYPTMYGMMSVTIFREPRLLFVATRINSIDAWAISIYEGEQADKLMAHIENMTGAAGKEDKPAPFNPDNLTLDFPDLGEPVNTEAPMYEGDPID